MATWYWGFFPKNSFVPSCHGPFFSFFFFFFFFGVGSLHFEILPPQKNRTVMAALKCHEMPPHEACLYDGRAAAPPAHLYKRKFLVLRFWTCQLFIFPDVALKNLAIKKLCLIFCHTCSNVDPCMALANRKAKWNPNANSQISKTQ